MCKTQAGGGALWKDSPQPLGYPYTERAVRLEFSSRNPSEPGLNPPHPSPQGTAGISWAWSSSRLAPDLIKPLSTPSGVLPRRGNFPGGVAAGRGCWTTCSCSEKSRPCASPIGRISPPGSLAPPEPVPCAKKHETLERGAAIFASATMTAGGSSVPLGGPEGPAPYANEREPLRRTSPTRRAPPPMLIRDRLSHKAVRRPTQPAREPFVRAVGCAR